MKTVKFQTINSPISKGKKKVLSPEAKSKRRQLKKKFNIDKAKLNEEDLVKLMTSIDIENEKNDLNEQSKKLLNKLDKDNLGYVETDDFVEEIINRNEKSIDDEFSLFYKKINENLFTKSEEIIQKLKKLKNKKWKKEKKNFLESIEIIINLISNIEDSDRKETDFIKMRIQSTKYTKNSSSISKTPNSKRRRSTNLNTLVSPSIVASMYDQMSKIDKCDFNIFELDKF